MEITRRAGFLVVSYSLTDRVSRVGIARDLNEVIQTWRSSTRLSPLYATNLTDEASLPSLDGTGHIIFCGPTNPADLGDLPVGIKLWLTLGTFNIVAYADAPEVASAFQEQLTGLRTSSEIWTVTNGTVVEVKFNQAQPSDTPVPDSLARLANLDAIPSELHTSVSEYCTLMAATLQRTHQVLPSVVGDLLAVHAFVLEAIKTTDLSSRTHRYRTLGVLAHLNAGLSRFCAQTLSGISPILHTECHFWIHSLLGTGIGNIVLHRFAAFVIRKMDGNRLPARLRQLSLRTDALPDLAAAPVDFWHENHLENVVMPSTESVEPLVPLLTYFSGRDGFRSGLNTISAPLASLGACNARQWSLMTITHEITHIVVRGALTVIFPDPTRSAGQEILKGYLERRGNTWLRCLQFYLLENVIAMQQAAERAGGTPVTKSWDERKLSVVLDRWHHEIEEILVHVFDFLYFYGQDTERYVRSIWLTWGVIPNIANRVNEYVLRTLCAALVKHLRREGAEEVARAEVLRIFEDLRGEDSGPYVEMAHALLSDDALWPALRSALTARKGLVKIVRGFLYWDKAAQDLRGDQTVSSDASERGGYRLRVRHLTQEKVENPLRVIEEYTDSLTPSEVSSVWLLYALTFNVRDRSDV